jgi:hypothetical protein
MMVDDEMFPCDQVGTGNREARWEIRSSVTRTSVDGALQGNDMTAPGRESGP